MGLRAKLFALTYDRALAGTERAGLAETRRRLLARASGDVLEVGAGTGLNLPYYGDTLGSLTLSEPDVSMLRRLERAVTIAARPATVLRAPAEDLPFEDGSFDTVVSTLVLCGVPDQPRAAREIKRVLKPGGQLLFVEHVRATDERLARNQDRMNWLNRLVAGCDCNRPTLWTLQSSGFVVDHLVEGNLPKAPPFVRPLIVGSAARPSRSSDPLTSTGGRS